MKAIAFDKTGTLTEGKPTVTDVYVRENITEKEVLYITASIESHSTHPLAESIVKYAQHAYDITLKKPEKVEDVTGFGLKRNIGKQRL